MKNYKEFRSLYVDELEEILNSDEFISIGGKLFHMYSESDYQSGETIFILEDCHGYAIILRNGGLEMSYYSLRKYLDKYPSVERRLINSFNENKTYKSNDELFTFVI